MYYAINKLQPYCGGGIPTDFFCFSQKLYPPAYLVVFSCCGSTCFSDAVVLFWLDTFCLPMLISVGVELHTCTSILPCSNFCVPLAIHERVYTQALHVFYPV